MNNKIGTRYVCSKELCSGCKACKQICPVNAIDIVADNEGFEYPIKNEKCINCGLCANICPMLNKIENTKKLNSPEVFCCENNSEEILNKSSSGGAFTSIVEAFCDDNYIIFGVEFTRKNKAIHSYIDNKMDIDKYRKSKYVQSDVRDSYKIAKKFLEEGKKVLFTGTPCQIAGLRQYLRKEYSNLLTVDLICHGVPSQKVLDKYIEYIEKKYKSKVVKLNFREKTCKKGKWNSKNILIEFENGKKILENTEKNLYLRGFSGELFFRMSCNKCKFANPNRISDITIGDCWGIEKLYPNIDLHKGASLMIINTEKGKSLLSKINEKQNYRRIEMNFAITQNAQLRQPTDFNNNRKYFFENLDKMKFDKLINKCISQKRLKRIISKIVPEKIKKHIRKLRN